MNQEVKFKKRILVIEIRNLSLCDIMKLGI